MGEEPAPVLPVAVDEAPPVELRSHRVDDMRDVGSVEALALHDQTFRPQHLFWRDEQNVEIEHAFADRFLEPYVVDFGLSVSGAEDQIDEVVVVPRLPDPVRKL